MLETAVAIPKEATARSDEVGGLGLARRSTQRFAAAWQAEKPPVRVYAGANPRENLA